jgi:hypothetical protein
MNTTTTGPAPITAAEAREKAAVLVRDSFDGDVAAAQAFLLGFDGPMTEVGKINMAHYIVALDTM